MREIQEPYTEIGSIALASTTPAVGARDAATIEALSNAVLYTVPDGIPSLEFQFRCNDANNASVVLDFLWCRGKQAGHGDYTRCATVTLTVGQQAADTGYTFADTVAISNDASDQEIVAISPENDYIGSVKMNLMGYGKLCIVATTLTADKTIDVDVAYSTYRFEPLKS